jgi:hypothetical protein
MKEDKCNRQKRKGNMSSEGPRKYRRSNGPREKEMQSVDGYGRWTRARGYEQNRLLG